MASTGHPSGVAGGKHSKRSPGSLQVVGGGLKTSGTRFLPLCTLQLDRKSLTEGFPRFLFGVPVETGIWGSTSFCLFLVFVVWVKTEMTRVSENDGADYMIIHCSMLVC